MEWHEYILELSGVFTYSGRRNKIFVERKLQQYLQTVTITSCSTDLTSALGFLLEDIDHVDQVFAEFASKNSRGESFWTQNSFAVYLGVVLRSDQAVMSCTPLLWRIFVASAHFPFLPSELEETEVEHEGFRRAIALLVMRGPELLGARHDGQPLFQEDRFEEKYAQKIPRVIRFIFSCLSKLSKAHGSNHQTILEESQLLDIRDTLKFTLPSTDTKSYLHQAHVSKEDFEAAARRLLRLNNEQSKVSGSSPAMVHEIDLQALTDLFLRLRLEDERWKTGKSYFDMFQRSGDIQYCQMISTPNETSDITGLARTFVTGQLQGTDGLICLESFSAWCKDRPSFVYSFFQLWASMFARTSNDGSSEHDETALAIPTANILSLLHVANPSGEKDQPNYRFHTSELQIQLDLQRSKLVADLTSQQELHETVLHQTITMRDWFHVMLIRGDDLEPDKRIGRKSSRLIAAFLSPPMNEVWRHEDGIWHRNCKEMCREDGDRWTDYNWRSSAVQLQPNLVVANSGGMSAYVFSGLLALRSHGAAVGQDTQIDVNLRERLVNIAGLDDKPEKTIQTSGTLRMRLTDLKCYRLPGIASSVRYHPSSLSQFSDVPMGPFMT